MSTAAIVLAAGQGKRMNSPVKKQYIEIAGRPLLYYPLKAFEESCVDAVVVVASAEDVSFVRSDIIERFGFGKVSAVVAGSDERFRSVRCGLEVVTQDYVLIHDGARPMITALLIDRCVAEVEREGAVAVGVRSKDTVKIVDEGLKICETPPREQIWIAQTPQAFSRKLLSEAYKKLEELGRAGSYIPTDDAMLVQDMTGVKAVMLEGDYTNIKVTTPDDLDMVERILKN